MSEVPKFENKDFRITAKTGNEADLPAELSYTYKGELLFTEDTKKLFLINENSGGVANPSTTTQINFFEKSGTDIVLMSGADLGLITSGALSVGGTLSLSGAAVFGGNLTVSGKISNNEVDHGDAGGFSGMKFNATDTTLDFYIDGTKVAHIAADGTYTDDVA